MSSNPRITVLMSVYNGEKFLRDAIDSILNQTYRDFEFVIYDDCSTDNTLNIIESYNDSRIICRRNVINRGLTWNLADGVSSSKADYIVRMDGDDIAYPHRLEQQLEWMDRHPEITIMGTPVSYFHETPGDGGVAPQPQDDATIKALLFISFTMLHPSIIIRRQDLVRNKLNYDSSFRYSQDHALYLECIRAGLKFANYPAPLLHMRSHYGSISQARHEEQQECSRRARRAFLDATGIAEQCNDEEIEIYNTFASGVYPDSVEKVHAYERFVEKIYANPNTTEYFDIEMLRSAMATFFCNSAYFAIKQKVLYCSSLAGYRSSLRLYASKWPLSMKIKYMVKRIRTLATV